MKGGIQEEESQSDVSILDFMKKGTDKSTNQSNNNTLVTNYLSIIDDTVVNIQQASETDTCPQCNQKMFLNPDDSFIFCDSCGYTKNIVINS